MTEQTFPTTHCTFGVARRDVTPPVGIYARSWGAATHEVAEGVHRPLTATAAVFAPHDGDGPELALVALDIGWLQYAPDETGLRASIRERTGLGEEQLLVSMSHTHAGANANSQLADKPGVELIQPYLDGLAEHIADAILDARATRAEALVTYGYGRCGLATNRDFWDEDAGRFACGYNPGAPADDTLLVGRVTGTDGAILATLFNYACHPTTLAWDNRLLSPDYIGAAREVLEQAFDARRSSSTAPRASSPRATTTSATRPSPTATAASSAMRPRPRSRRCRPPEPASSTRASSPRAPTSARGSTGRASRRSSPRAAASRAQLTEVELRRKDEPAIVESLTDAKPDAVQEREKALRRAFLELALGDGPTHRMPLWTWRLGEALADRAAERGVLGVPDRAPPPLRGRAGLRPDDDERRRRLPLPARELRQRALPGAAIALRTGLPRGGDRRLGRRPDPHSARLS